MKNAKLGLRWEIGDHFWHITRYKQLTLCTRKMSRVKLIPSPPKNVFFYDESDAENWVSQQDSRRHQNKQPPLIRARIASSNTSSSPRWAKDEHSTCLTAFKDKVCVIFIFFQSALLPMKIWTRQCIRHGNCDSVLHCRPHGSQRLSSFLRKPSKSLQRPNLKNI